MFLKTLIKWNHTYASSWSSSILQIAASWAILFGTPVVDASPEIRNQVSGVQEQHEEQHAVAELTEGTLHRTAGGRVDLPPVVLNPFGHFYERGVSSEAAFGPGGRKKLFGTVFYVSTGLLYNFILRWALRCGVFKVCS